MPGGVTWAAYLRFNAAALLTMLAGAQTVHLLYRPLDDMDLLVREERRRREQTNTLRPASSGADGGTGQG